MNRTRFSSVVLPLTLGAALVVLCQFNPGRGDGPTPRPATREEGDADITPIASEIKTLRNVELTIDKEKVKASIHYALKSQAKGATVILLPVFTVSGKPELRWGSGRGRVRVCQPDRPLVEEDDAGPLRLRVKLANLLAEQSHREAIEERLKKVIADREGAKVIRLADATVDWNGFHVTLCASGTGSGPAGGEVVLSQLAVLPPRVAEDGGEITLELLPENIALLRENKDRAVTLSDVYLRIDGSMRAEFRTNQYRANFSVVRRELTGLQTRLRSISPSAKEPPEAFVQVPSGGSVEDDRSVESIVAQYIVGEISVRKGQDPRFIQELTERVLSRVLEKVRLDSLEDKKRVAVLLGNQVTVAATVGEIKALARQTRAQREKELKTALDDWEARQRGEEREYRGSLGVEASFGNRLIGGRGAVKVDAAMRKKLEEANARRRKQTLESVNRGLDEMKKHFAGTIPTLTGIQFTQKGKLTSFGTNDVELSGSTFERGWSQHQWPALWMTNTPSLAISSRVLAEQVAATRTRYEEVEKALDSSDSKVRTARQRVADLEKELARPKSRLEALLDGSDKRLGTLRQEATALEKQLGSVKDALASIKGADRRIRGLRDQLAEAERDLAAYRKVGTALGSLQARLDEMEGSMAPTGLARTWKDRGRVKCAVCSPDGKRVVWGTSDGVLRVWNRSDERLSTLEGHLVVWSLAISKDGKYALSGGAKKIRLWDLGTGKLVRTLEGHDSPVFGVAFSPDGRSAASAGSDETVRIWDVEKGTERHKFALHTGSVLGVAFSPSGSFVLSGSMDGTVRVWDVDNARPVSVFKEHKSGVNCVALAPNGRVAVSGARNGTLLVWEVATGKVLQTLTGHSKPVSSVACSRAGVIASGSADGTVRLWDPNTGKELHQFADHGQEVTGVSFAPFGSVLISAGEDQTCRRWNLGRFSRVDPGALSGTYRGAR